MPWHTKSTRIIVFSPLKLPWNAVFCKVLSAFQGIVVFFSFTTFFAKKCKMKQITSICSSQIVVSLGGADYYSNKFPNLINLLISVTCSRHLNLTDFEVGASCSIALQGKAKTGYPRVSRGSFFIRLRIFSVLLCTFFIYSFSFFQNIDRRIHIPVHPVSTFA